MARRNGVAFDLVRHGADHDQFRMGRALLAIPRHREISELTARGILREASRHCGEEGS
jgi:mRNA interferase HicA